MVVVSILDVGVIVVIRRASYAVRYRSHVGRRTSCVVCRASHVAQSMYYTGMSHGNRFRDALFGPGVDLCRDSVGIRWRSGAIRWRSGGIWRRHVLKASA